MLSGTFLRGANPKWYFFLLDGTGPVTPTAYISFLSNTFPYLPQNVYMDPLGQTVWGQPIEFDTSGSIPDNIYFDPTLVYRIEVRNGPTSNDPLIVQPIENYTVGEGEGNATSGVALENLITNPQFAYINFGSPDTLKLQTGQTTATFNIAPGWFLALTGPLTAKTVLTQNFYSASGLQVTGNPETSLTIANTGWTSAILYQQFANGNLFANNGVSISFLAKSVLNIEPITAQIVDNTGATTVIFSDTVTTNFNTFVGAQNIPPNTTNTVAYPNSSVQMQIILPPTGTIEITNLQLFTSSIPISLPYEILSIERQRDHMFNIYASQLIYKPKKNLLVGWNFSQNPYQFIPIGQTAITSTNNFNGQIDYIADQTILYQETPNAIAIDNSQIGQRRVLQILPNGTATNTRFALIQYIDPATIRPLWSYVVSSLARIKMNSIAVPATQVHIKMRLLWRTTLPPTLSAMEPIVSWAVDSDPIFATGWTAIIPNNDPSYLLSDTYSTDETPGGASFSAYPFEGFDLPNDSASPMTLAIVIYTMDRMVGGLNPPDSVAFDRVSLVPNKFATDAETQTFDESFRECQYYFEKSYQIGVPPATPGVSPNGLQLRQLNVSYASGNAQGFLRSFTLDFKQIKRTSTPIFTFYSPQNGNVSHYDVILQGNMGVITGPTTINGNYTVNALSEESAVLLCTDPATAVITGTTTAGQEGIMQFHYTVDARLGL